MGKTGLGNKLAPESECGVSPMQHKFEEWWREKTYRNPPGPPDVPLLRKLPDGDYVNDRVKQDFAAFCGGYVRGQKEAAA